MKWLLIALVTLAPAYAQAAEPVFRIEFDSSNKFNSKDYSDSSLRRRVWELERAVWQLQQKVFQLENTRPIHISPPIAPIPPRNLGWVCKVTAMGNTYTGAGDSRAVAKMRALESCKAARGGDAFFCNEAGCEQ